MLIEINKKLDDKNGNTKVGKLLINPANITTLEFAIDFTDDSSGQNMFVIFHMFINSIDYITRIKRVSMQDFEANISNLKCYFTDTLEEADMLKKAMETCSSPKVSKNKKSS